MDINTLLSELVILANDLDGKNQDISADVDAAIFIMSSDSALPRNKSLAAVVRENYAAVGDMDELTIEDLAVSAAEEIAELTEAVLEQRDSKAVVAVLTSMAQSLRSVLYPNGTMSRDVAEAGARFLQAAETKLSQDEELHSIGYRIGLVRSKIESSS
ncbi:hypothetical protein LCGC14_0407500 [marine sediment metagenome]|jgi:hypothetical protein|uniref:Uncharacterized protein n=1 Tax=marine sediment metagenome TaxID=412755 RepID=A0A0F9W439_9ZZZZ